MNKYSEWIFWYLESGFLIRDDLKNKLGAMNVDFHMRFPTYTHWTNTRRCELGTEEDKLSFYWLLAHVDQETADEMLK